MAFIHQHESCVGKGAKGRRRGLRERVTYYDTLGKQIRILGFPGAKDAHWRSSTLNRNGQPCSVIGSEQPMGKPKPRVTAVMEAEGNKRALP